MRRWSEKVREEEAKAPGGGHGGEERDPALYVSVECRFGWGMRDSCSALSDCGCWWYAALKK